METEKVVVDADFFRRLTDGESNTVLFEKILKTLGYEPVMHKYVAKKELKDNLLLDNLIRNNKIEILDERKCISDEDKSDYEEYFRIVYKKLNLFDLTETADVYEYGYNEEASGESLGEIRSLYMARYLGYSVFLSDDSDSGIVAEYLRSNRRDIRVYGVVDALLKCKEVGTTICYRDIKNLFYRLEKIKCRRIDELRKAYPDS